MSARAMKYWIAACAFFWALVLSLAAEAQIYSPIVNGGGGGFIIPGGGNGTWASGQLRGPDGTACTSPSYSFTSTTTTGMTIDGTGVTTCYAGVKAITATSGFIYVKGPLNIGNGTINTSASVLASDAADTLAQKNGTAAQVRRLYFSTTGPVYFQETARTAGVLMTGTGGAMQLSTAQTTVPTCTANCGTSPSVAGTDTAMRVTMGASGVPASAWVVTFNGTWPAAPVCSVTAALATMVVGKQAIAVVTTTTTITVTTNGTAPGTSDQYQILCMGVS